jgi:hypothetical protein
MSAFHGDPRTKDDALAALEASPPSALVAPAGASAVGLIAWADRVGLPPALVLLGARLSAARSLAASPVSVSDARAFLAAIEPGASTARVPNAWTVWAWEAAPAPLRALLSSSRCIDAASAAMVLHRRAAAGGEVARGEWRGARLDLGRLAEGEDDQARAMATIAAGAWDFELIPGAVTDLLQAWEGLSRPSIRRTADWRNGDDVRLAAMLAEVKPRLEQGVGPRPARTDAAAFNSYVDRLQTELDRLMSGLGDATWDRHKALQAQFAGAAATRRRQGRQALIALLRAASRPAIPDQPVIVS